MKHIVSFSGGKDSTAMLLMMVERKMPIDYILFCDTGKEFDELYQHIRNVEKYIGIPVTWLKANTTYEYNLYERIVSRGKYKGRVGYGWPSMMNRWCTREFKQVPIKNFYKSLNVPKTEIFDYIGIAYDEPKRIREIERVRYPLYEWKITEAQALQYCYNKGFDFGGLYEHFDRLGCWCCPLTNIKDLYNLYKYYPDKWQELLQMERDMYINIKCDDISKIYPFNLRNKVSELDERFSQGIIYKRNKIENSKLF